MRSRGISSPDCIAAQKRPACFSSLSMVSGLFVHRQRVTPDRAVRVSLRGLRSVPATALST
jgi:hypothetical protein